MKSQKTNLILALILLVGGAGSLWYEYKYRPKLEKRKTEESKLIPSLIEKEWEKASITSKGLKVVFKCETICRGDGFDKGSWQILEPLVAKADAQNIHNTIHGLVNSMAAESVDVSGEQDAALAGLGLDQSARNKAVLEIWGKGQSEPTRVYFGEKAAIGDNVYTYILGPGGNDKKVFLLASVYSDFASKSLSHWREKKLIPWTSQDVTALKLHSDRGEVQLKKGEKGWVFAQNDKPAESVAVDSYLMSLTNALAIDFVSDQKSADMKKFDLPPNPKVIVSLKNQKNEELIAEVWENKRQPAEQFFSIKGKELLAKIDLGTYQKFFKGSEEFRLKNLVAFDERAAASQYQLQWKQEKPFETKGNQSFKSEEFLEKLSAVRINAFLSNGQQSQVKKPDKIQLMISVLARNEAGKVVWQRKLYRQDTKAGLSARWFATLSDGEYVEIDGLASEKLTSFFSDEKDQSQKQSIGQSKFSAGSATSAHK